jgi:tetratricopeptide (TPR) repeat protein
MKKILMTSLLFVSIFLVSCGSPEKSWNKAIESFNNKNYAEAETILNSIIEKYPTSEFAGKSKEKIAEIYWNRAIESIDNQNYAEAETILNSIIEKYPTSEFTTKSKKVIQELQIAKMKSKAKDVINAIRRRKNEIMNGSTTMLQVITDTIGKPDKTFDDKNNNILLYGEEVSEAKKENLKSFSFVIKVPILGAKTIKGMSVAFQNGKRINKGIGKLICAQLNKIDKETSAEFNSAMYRMSAGYGYYSNADAYQTGVNIANKMTVRIERAISCEHIFDLQFERLQIWSFDRRLV